MITITKDCSGKAFMQYTLSANGACQFMPAAGVYLKLYLDSLTTCSTLVAEIYGPTDTTCTTMIMTKNIDPKMYLGIPTSTVNTCSATNGFGGGLGYGTVACSSSNQMISSKPNIVAT